MCSSDPIGSVVAAKQSQVYAQIGVAVLAKGIDAQKGAGEAMVGLLEAATEIAKQLGKGLQFDARA